ncbi:protein transport protein Sec31A isoform X2 [Hypomesus transpacificus]|uniref:protein transport protein Sec31A isoform X2 n=1 Tax=Hypomesus transpacificus TaxID=137520 RepID=UPI001F0866ED|nr:protein transport protein Sec31A isoform X2 [Hypomesus transpacificus]
MKLKEINRTAIQSWSPAQQHPVYLAAGTSAQQLDASFSTNASLEIFELDLAEPSLDMKSCGTYSSSHRYHKLVWGPHGMEGSHPSGVLIAGGENGDVILYDPAKIVAGDSDVIITQSNKHTGPVRALDVNSFQTNLVASGGNESEIYIWDLNNFGSPMTPGPKTQPLEDISCVAWNRQVQHILASASPSGRASVWDLRKNDLIIKVSDHSNRMHCSGLAWNPEVATQLVLASEDDRMPVIQMWDLRFATSPFKILENHTRGVLAIAWSLADPELLLSCGKDNRILCWNPNTAEVLYELPTSTQWCFDIQWCPRNPAVLSAAAFDGHIGIYSIMGGSSQAHTQRQADQITSSFGNMDPFGTGQTLPPLQMPQTPAAPVTITPLKKPPKWIRRPVGASFAFGGKLVSLENLKLNPQQPQQTTAHLVHVSQVVTETAFLKRSGQLQMTLSSGNFVDFCEAKIAAAQNEFERTIWSFLKVNFEDDARGKYLELLGYKKEELALKIAAALEEKPVQPEKPPSAAAAVTGLSPDPGLNAVPQVNLHPPVLQSVELPSQPPAPELVVEVPSQPPAPEPVIEFASQPPAPEPVVEFASQPPAPEPVVEFASQPPAPEPVVEFASQPPAPEPVVEFASQPPAPEPVVKFPSEFLIEPGFQLDSNYDLLLASDLTAPVLAPHSAPLLDLSIDPALAPAALLQIQPDPSLSTPSLCASAELLSVTGFDLEPPVNLQPLSQFDHIDLQQPASVFDQFGVTPQVDLLQPVPQLDLTNSVNLQPVPDFDPASSLGLQLLPDFDPTPSLNLQPVAELDPAPPISLPPLVDSGLNLSADLPPEAAFDLIAAANLQPAVEPEETPAPEAEVPAGLLEPEVDPEGETPEASDGEVQTEPSAVEPLHVEEEIPLEEEVTAPVEAAPVEAAPVEAESSPAEETVEEITGPGSVEAGINLRVSQDVDGLITQALLTGDFEGAVELCLHDNRMADSIILAIAGGAELLEKTQKKYFTKTHSKITKLISAVVTKDWRDVLQTCDLQSWKEALAAVMTYAQPDEFSSLCGMMGSRLEAAEEDQLQAQACLCYICAGNLEKLVSCWTKAQDGQCPLSLQDLVEKVVVLRQAVERSQGSGSSVVGALLAEKMSQYSSLLASQGSLDTALAYLPDNTNQAAVQQLRERLSRALGQQATAPPAPAPAPAPAQPPAPQQTEAHPRQTYNPGQPQVPQPAPAPVPSAGPTQSQYYQPARSATTVTSWSNQTPTGFPSAPPPPQLAHASDQKVEAGQPRFGMQAPGTAAPPQASAAPPSYMYSQQYQPYHQVNQFQPGAGAPTIYQPLQYSAAPLPPASSCCPPAPAPGFRAQYMQPGPPPPGPPPPRYPGPPAGQPPSPHPLSPTASSAFSPLSSSSGASFQHGGPGSPSSYMPPPPPTGSSGGLNPDTDCFMEGPQNGWNDPPALSRVPKKKKVPENYTPPAPITAPIMSPLGGDPQAQQVPAMPPQPVVHGQPGLQAPYPGMQQQQPLPHQPMNPALPQTSVEGAPGAPIGDVIQPLQSIPAEKITKKPIPDEHLVLKSTFEGLIQKCLAAANDPQTKRKLDDANKRLEALYDKLREQTLSPAIVGGLHNMVRSIEARSYTEGLGIHTHIVSTNNFSETSAFMPVLKVVLTQANRLGV